MATAAQITALIKSFKENDKERFVVTALQLAAHEAKRGHNAVADEIRSLVESIKEQRGHAKVISFKQPAELDGLALSALPDERLSDLILPSPLLGRIEKVLLEYRQQAKLREHGLTPRRKLLLAGPPGTGKTLTARVLAGELHLQQYTVLLDKLTTKYLGETSAKLRQIFEVIGRQRGVYLFDEFDAIGGDRGRDNDIGEIRRVLNTFLQLLEQDGSGSIIVAATNTAKNLDPALFRRFDDVLYYANPDSVDIARLIKNRLSVFRLCSESFDYVESAANLSHAEITQACVDAMKETILADENCIPRERLIQALEERRNSYSYKND